MTSSQKLVRSWLLLSTLILLAKLLIANAHAFELSPTVSVITLPQDAGGITLYLKNPREKPLPVELNMVERTVHEDGAEDYKPADALFLVFPPQAVINPGETQAFRVQWLGDAPAESRSFTLFAKEIPVDLTASGSPQVQTVFKMGASIHVTPAAAKPDISLTHSQVTGKDLQITLKNSGNRFIYLNEVSLIFPDKTYTGTDLANIAGRTLLTPGSIRTFTVPGETQAPKVAQQ